MANNVLLRILDNNILVRPIFKDWLRNLRIVLDFKKIGYVLETSLPIDIALDASDEERKKFKT